MRHLKSASAFFLTLAFDAISTLGTKGLLWKWRLDLSEFMWERCLVPLIWRLGISMHCFYVWLFAIDPGLCWEMLRFHFKYCSLSYFFTICKWVKSGRELDLYIPSKWTKYFGCLFLNCVEYKNVTWWRPSLSSFMVFALNLRGETAGKMNFSSYFDPVQILNISVLKSLHWTAFDYFTGSIFIFLCGNCRCKDHFPHFSYPFAVTVAPCSG